MTTNRLSSQSCEIAVSEGTHLPIRKREKHQKSLHSVRPHRIAWTLCPSSKGWVWVPFFWKPQNVFATYLQIGNFFLFKPIEPQISMERMVLRKTLACTYIHYLVGLGAPRASRNNVGTALGASFVALSLLSRNQAISKKIRNCP